MMRVRIECRVCGVAKELVVDSGLGDTEEEVLAAAERDGEDICDECAAFEDE